MIIEIIFKELSRILPFENLRDEKERAKFIACQQTKIVAMTSDYAVSKYMKLRESGFQYNTLVIDDASLVHDLDFTAILLS